MRETKVVALDARRPAIGADLLFVYDEKYQHKLMVESTSLQRN